MSHISRNMKSSSAQRASRGYADAAYTERFARCTADELAALLRSSNPQQRTAAAVCMGQRRDHSFIALLCDALAEERKLYAKLAICEALAAYGAVAALPLARLLGCIGKNQHRAPVRVDLGKKSFPLPRDIAARILIRIGEDALPCLETMLKEGSQLQKAEALDAVGHIAGSTGNTAMEDYLFIMLEQGCSELIRWKIIRAMQSFPGERVENYLLKIAEQDAEPLCAEEAMRSLRRIRASE